MMIHLPIFSGGMGWASQVDAALPARAGCLAVTLATAVRPVAEGGLGQAAPAEVDPSPSAAKKSGGTGAAAQRAEKRKDRLSELVYVRKPAPAPQAFVKCLAW